MDQTHKPPRRQLSSSPGARRTRAYRKRLRSGLQFIPVPVDVSDIDTLVAKGLLKEGERHDRAALQAALAQIFYKFLDE